MYGSDFHGKIQVGHKYRMHYGIALCVAGPLLSFSGDPYYLMVFRKTYYGGKQSDETFNCHEDGWVGKMELDIQEEVVETEIK